MAASPAIVLNWEVQPNLLTDNVNTPLDLTVNSDASIAPLARKLLHAVAPPGRPGILIVPYKMLLLLIGMVAKPDGADAALSRGAAAVSQPAVAAAAARVRATAGAAGRRPARRVDVPGPPSAHRWATLGRGVGEQWEGYECHQKDGDSRRNRQNACARVSRVPYRPCLS